ncbi:MAG TPA: hypothetical protein VFM39_03370, partial [bacterium]|nr:hypothetical protein [bacterium]
RRPYPGEAVYAMQLEYPGGPVHDEVLIDKSRTPHFLYCTERLSQGVLYHSCGLLNLKSLQATNLFGSVSDQGEGCPPDFAGRSFGRAGWYSFHVTDWNRDGYRDVVVTGTEENCKTHKRVRIQRVFVATKSGFRRLK